MRKGHRDQGKRLWSSMGKSPHNSIKRGLCAFCKKKNGDFGRERGGKSFGVAGG